MDSPPLSVCERAGSGGGRGRMENEVTHRGRGYAQRPGLRTSRSCGQGFQGFSFPGGKDLGISQAEGISSNFPLKSG